MIIMRVNTNDTIFMGNSYVYEVKCHAYILSILGTFPLDSIEDILISNDGKNNDFYCI